MNAKRVAVCAVSVALLIALQLTLSYIPGVELVTALLLCFCYSFGICMGLITATSFSLLRCILFGFNPNVIILYLVYYNLFAVLFGILGKKTIPPWICFTILSIVAVASAYFAVTGLPISILYQLQVTIMLWFVFAISVALIITYAVLLIVNVGRAGREIASVTALAAVCTICFSLLDDVISPLFYGYSLEAAKAYFVSSLYIMIPQTLCTLISVALLFHPLVTVFKKVTV